MAGAGGTLSFGTQFQGVRGVIEGLIFEQDSDGISTVLQGDYYNKGVLDRFDTEQRGMNSWEANSC